MAMSCNSYSRNSFNERDLLFSTRGLLRAIALGFSSFCAVAASQGQQSNPTQAPVAHQIAMSYRSAGNRPGSSSLGEMIQEGPSGGIWQQGTLLGDMGGFRTELGLLGVSLDLVETSEVLGNVSGGYQQGADYDGLDDYDRPPARHAEGLWMEGGLFNLSGLDLHGDNLSARDLGTLQTASGIEADRSDRLWELWYQADVRQRPGRHQGRPAEPGPGIHQQPVRGTVREHDVRVADAPSGRPSVEGDPHTRCHLSA